MSKTILIMAGGTGGHVFPGLAVADYLRGQGWRVVWLGTDAGMERRLVPARGYPMETIRFSGVRGKGALAWLLLPLLLLVAFWQSARAIFRVRPDVVLGMGGYPAFPGGMMAALFLRPLAIHEQNSVAGLANRVLALVADRVLVAFPDPFSKKAEGRRQKAEGKRGFDPSSFILHPSSFLPHPSSLEVVGNPVREEIAALPAPEERFAGRAGRLQLLVVGGSLGAQALNTAVPRALALIPDAERPIVRHQSGEKHIESLGRAYAEAGVDAEPVAFIEDMAGAYAQADLVICRAGALTIAELAAAGVASVLVPFPHAVDDHQSVNARYLSDKGAAVLLPQAEMDPERLAQLLRSLDRGKLLEMAKAARALGRPEAVRELARHCEELAA